LPERADRLPEVVGYFVAGYASLVPEGRGKSARFFQKLASAAVRQFSIALITLSGRGSHGRHSYDAKSIRGPERYPQPQEPDTP
jgi:hypothetical protein